jgi:carbonic anhydrase
MASQTPYKGYDFAAANRHYAEYLFPERNPKVGSRSRTVIVTCCDARCAPEHFFKLTEQEASVLRNEGGRAADPGVLRTIVLLNCLGADVGASIAEIKVIHHTGSYD